MEGGAGVFTVDRIAHRSFRLDMLISFSPQDFDSLLPMRMKVHPGVKHFWRQLYVVLQTICPSSITESLPDSIFTCSKEHPTIWKIKCAGMPVKYLRTAWHAPVERIVFPFPRQLDLIKTNFDLSIATHLAAQCMCQRLTPHTDSYVRHIVRDAPTYEYC